MHEKDIRRKWQPLAGSPLDLALVAAAAAVAVETEIAAERAALEERRRAAETVLESAEWRGAAESVPAVAHALAVVDAADILAARIDGALLAASAESNARRREVGRIVEALEGHEQGLSTIRGRRGEKAPETFAAALRLSKAKRMYLGNVPARAASE